MSRVVDFAGALIKRGYSAYPMSVSLDEEGDKLLAFKDNKWAAGEYPTDPAAIEAHWEGFDGVMINTGRSGLVVLDIDMKKGKDGFAALRSEGLDLPDTPVKVRTPTGGEHWFYREPEGLQVQSSADKLAEGVDIRARGGLVIAPPTEIPGRGAYEFINPKGMVPVSELPVFPEAIVDTLQPRKIEIATADTRPLLTFEQRQRMQGKLDRILRDLATMEDGTRNATMRLRMIRLFGIAMTLGEDPHAVAALAREAYFESGGTAERELESFIEWAQDHARYELPEEETDEAFEAEVASAMRKKRIQEEALARLSPVKAERISDDDILEFDPNLDNGDWIIEEVMPRGETVILFGPPNAGKSFAGIDLACGVATGSSAWGFDVEPGKVLYLAGEGTRRLAVRRRAWEVFNDRTVDRDKVQFRKMRLRLADDRSVADHQDLVDQFKPDLIVVDTMMRATEGMVLENPGEASRAIAQLDRVREASPNAALLVLHHPAKSNPDNPAGSFPIEGNVDTMLKFLNEDGVRTMSIKKAREGDTSWTANFELRDIQIPGSQLSSAALAPSTRVAWDSFD